MMDMLRAPQVIHRAMRQMTDLWKHVVDVASDVILPAGQGTSNWTMGWSRRRFLCVGQNDVTCMISPRMFTDFCRQDNLECCNHVDRSLYHLDGPGALGHLPELLALERLDGIQWVPGEGNPPPSARLDLLGRIQRGGKSVQVCYHPAPNTNRVDLHKEIETLCRCLDHTRLFVWANVGSVEEADAVVDHARQVCRQKRGTRIGT